MLDAELHNAKELTTEYAKVLNTAINGYHYGLSNEQKHQLAIAESKRVPLSMNQLRNYFDDKNINPIRYQTSERKWSSDYVEQLRRLFHFYLGVRFATGYMKSFKLYFYRLLITSKPNNHQLYGYNSTNFRLIDSNGVNTVSNIHNALSKLRKRLSRIHSPLHILNDNLVNMYNPFYIYNVHVQGTVISTVPLKMNVQKHLRSYLSKYLGYTVNPNLSYAPMLLPLMNTKSSKLEPVVITSSNLSDDSNFNSLAQWITHSNRTNILPLVTSDNDIDNWKRMNPFLRKEYMFSWFNTVTKPKRVYGTRSLANPNIIFNKRIVTPKRRTRYTFSITRKIRDVQKELRIYKQLTIQLACIYSELAKYGVSEQQALPIRVTVIQPTKEHRYNSTSFRRLIRSHKQIINAREILQQGRLSYQRAIGTTRIPAVCVAKKHSLTITFASPSILNFRNDSKNKELALFNSS